MQVNTSLQQVPPKHEFAYDLTFLGHVIQKRIKAYRNTQFINNHGRRNWQVFRATETTTSLPN